MNRRFHVEIAKLGGEVIKDIIKLLVTRNQNEIKQLANTTQKNNIIISKCWNIIRVIVDLEEFVPIHIDIIEEQLQPLFEYMVEPEKIEFEEEVFAVVITLIKRRKAISPTM